jgi:putative SOS response-associated peptidase YedK
MRIALPKVAEAASLDPALTDAAAAIALARQSVVTEIVHHPVNSRVNNAKNDGPEMIERIDMANEPTTRFMFIELTKTALQ